MTENTAIVTRNDDKDRYDITVDGTTAGCAHFRVDDRGRYVFDATKVDPAFGGRGLGTMLVSEALGDVARRGDVVVPECPFVVKFLKENEVAGLVVDWRDSPEGGEGAQDAATGTEPPA